MSLWNMSISVEDNGYNNILEGPLDFRSKIHGSVVFEENESSIIIGRDVIGQNVNILLRTGATVHIGDNVQLGSIQIFILRPCKLVIAENTEIRGHAVITAHESADITIGHACLIESGVSFTVSDMHSIIDKNTGLRVNRPKSIVVGNCVRIGSGATILKGVEIGSGSIISPGSLVTKNIPNNSLAGGVPARILQEGVTWLDELI